VKDKQRRRWLSVITGGESLVSHAGGALLVATAGVTGLSGELSTRLGLWRRPWAIHDPGKIVLDLAVAVALGGDCAADIAVVRAQPGVFGLVASDPTVSRRNRRIFHDCSFANQAATFFAKSRSILKVSFSLRSRSGSSRSVSDNSLS
jgi:Transposase DDE domain group 1